MYNTRMETERQIKLQKELEKSLAEGLDPHLCNATWGNCTGDPMVQFGKPTETPHRCVGPKRHIRKLHRCGCGSHGHCVMPTALSKAGRETKHLMDLGDRLAGIAAGNTANELAAVQARNASE